uniref:RNase H type-1 domain-containing protein n=1 Tax=Arundo donax TaxID=35708 RepID=A0A0A9G3F5_ARUDO
MIEVMKGIHAAMASGMTKIVLEMDSTMVKHALEGQQYNPSALGNLNLDLKHLSDLHFSACSFCYCPRTCNNTI